MELSFKAIIVFGAVILTGLSAGLFYAWSVSVIPGTQRLSDTTYLETMQSINRGILNPAFFLIFFGSIILLCAASFYEFNPSRAAFWLLVGASITYLVGTIGVTGLGNVPLNNQLDVMKLAELAPEQISEFRSYYEQNWNRLHLLRTIFAVMSFMLSLAAVFVDQNKI